MAAPISKIELFLRTSDRAGASTDARVYLSVAGREYAVSRDDIDNFQPSTEAIAYVFGETANVRRPQDNDPRGPWQTDANDIGRCPTYIRFAPAGNDDNWDIEEVQLRVHFKGTEAGSIPQILQFSRLARSAHLWLGAQRGQFLFLVP